MKHRGIYYRYKQSIIGASSARKMTEWCKQNLQTSRWRVRAQSDHHHWRPDATFYFRHQEDFILFVLTWSEHIAEQRNELDLIDQMWRRERIVVSVALLVMGTLLVAMIAALVVLVRLST